MKATGRVNSPITTRMPPISSNQPEDLPSVAARVGPWVAAAAAAAFAAAAAAAAAGGGGGAGGKCRIFCVPCCRNTRPVTKRSRLRILGDQESRAFIGYPLQTQSLVPAVGPPVLSPPLGNSGMPQG